MSAKNVKSTNRKYVAICNKFEFNGFYCRRFVLPEEYDNNAEMAGWYFLNRLDAVACLELIMPADDYADISDCKTIAQNLS